ncbi:MAG: methyltransferase family protein [Candidatus Promineifilaceae bacterium]|jgi:protein-S-isoprenylcysteine O-methyltransferase Ste14
MSSSWWKGERGEWYVVVQFILFGIIFLAPFLTSQTSGWSDPWHMIGRVLGILLVILGGILALAGLASLGRNLAVVPYPKDDASFVGYGAYKIVRHPIYSGIILGAFGWGLLMNSVFTLLLAAVLFLFFDIKSRREEQWLGEKFDGYAAYQQRVHKLLPFIY